MYSGDEARAALKAFMRMRKLRPYPWAMAAGLRSDSAIRNFLDGRSESMTMKTLRPLAKAAGVTVDEMFTPTHKDIPGVLPPSDQHLLVSEEVVEGESEGGDMDQTYEMAVEALIRLSPKLRRQAYWEADERTKIQKHKVAANP